MYLKATAGSPSDLPDTLFANQHELQVSTINYLEILRLYPQGLAYGRNWGLWRPTAKAVISPGITLYSRLNTKFQ